MQVEVGWEVTRFIRKIEGSQVVSHNLQMAYAADVPYSDRLLMRMKCDMNKMNIFCLRLKSIIQHGLPIAFHCQSSNRQH